MLNKMLFSRNECFGSKMMCEYAMDRNETFLDQEVKQFLWPYSEELHGFGTSTTYKRMITMSKKMIVVKLSFKSPNVDMTVLDARTTLSDKIANFGGTFGIWAELTGFSLLGIINVIILMVKIFLNYLRH